MMRYWDDEQNTKKTITDDGWLKTGDQFCLRADGYGSVVGRLKEMIIRGGENIFPKVNCIIQGLKCFRYIEIVFFRKSSIL